jgi:chromate reductase, NAD(P)H dehydrogenase (quinone)
MKILAITGSLRRDSYNTALLRAARDLAPVGVAVELYDGLGAIPAFNEDLEGDPPAAVLDLRRRIAEADALLIATPEYNGSAPGALKNALDWASRPRGAAVIIGKPAAVIGASPSAFGAKWAQEQIRRALMLSGAMVVDPGLAVAKVDEKVVDGELADGGVRAQLGRVVDALVETTDAEQMLAA